MNENNKRRNNKKEPTLNKETDQILKTDLIQSQESKSDKRVRNEKLKIRKRNKKMK